VGEGYVKPRFGNDTRTNVVVIALVDDEEDHGSHPIKVYLY
jgi:hypothetical protein